jgi:GH24 family phage-related lysozyme (muramidase)
MYVDGCDDCLMDRGSIPLTSTNRNPFIINIYVTQQFDEGMKEIVLGLLAIGSAPYSADKIQDYLDKRSEPIEQKINAIDAVEDVMPSPTFHRAAEEYLKQYETRDRNEYTPPQRKVTKSDPTVQDFPPDKSDSDVLNLAGDLIKPVEIYGTDIGDPRNKKFLKPYTDDVGIYTIGIGHKIGDGSKSAKNQWIKKYGGSITPQFAEQLFNKRLNYHLKRVKNIFGLTFNDLNDDQAAVLLDISYRGDLLPGMEWVKLLQKGEYTEAANEYLDHKEYKRRKAKGRDGVVKRMERNAGILANQP